MRAVKQNGKALVFAQGFSALIAPQSTDEKLRRSRPAAPRYFVYFPFFPLLSRRSVHGTTERFRLRFGSSKALIQGYLILCNKSVSLRLCFRGAAPPGFWKSKSATAAVRVFPGPSALAARRSARPPGLIIKPNAHGLGRGQRGKTAGCGEPTCILLLYEKSVILL